MRNKIFLWDGMCPKNNLHPILFRNEFLEIFYIRTWRITNQKPCCKMNMRNTVLFHLFGSNLDVPAGATTSGCESSNLHFPIFINGKSTFTVFERPETFSACTGAITITNNDSNFNLFHSKSYLTLFYSLQNHLF